MSEAIHITNSANTAQKAHKTKKSEPPKATYSEADNKSHSSSGIQTKSNRNSKVYREWIALCTALCLCFVLLLTSGDHLRLISESDGVTAISSYLKMQLQKNSDIAAFFGFEKSQDNKSENSSLPTENETPSNDIPVFIFGEGLSASEYIEKYNKDAYIHAGTVPVMGIISSDYSFRKNPFWQVYADEDEYEFHKGVDIVANEGSDILCYLDGVVEKASLSASYGYYVTVDHGNGLKTLYAHASELLCDEGDKVSEGQVIALVGSTGRATGPHLHFEVYLDGELQDPKLFLDELYQ